MTGELLFTIIGWLLPILGLLLLILKLKGKPENDTFGKASKGQFIVLSMVLILGGLSTRCRLGKRSHWYLPASSGPTKVYDRALKT